MQVMVSLLLDRVRDFDAYNDHAFAMNKLSETRNG